MCLYKGHHGVERNLRLPSYRSLSANGLLAPYPQCRNIARGPLGVLEGLAHFERYPYKLYLMKSEGHTLTALAAPLELQTLHYYTNLDNIGDQKSCLSLLV